MKRKLGLGGVLMLVGLIATAARAEVRDDGNFFSPDAVQKANTAIQQMQRDLGKEMLIETYPAIPQDRASEYRPENKDEFFRKWGNERATAAHVNGAYILINRNPSYLFITAGSKTRERDFTTSDENQLRDQMLGLLKQKQFDAALAKAVEFVPQQIRENRQQAGGAATANRTPPPPPGGYNGPPAPNSSNVPAPAPSQGFKFGGIVLLLIILGVGWMILRALFGRRSTGSAPTGYGGYGNAGGYGGGGGGFGRGLLGGILGGMAGGWLQNRMSHRDGGGTGAPPVDPGGGGAFNEPSGDSSFSGGAGGSFDSGSSGGGDSGSSDGGTGGSF